MTKVSQLTDNSKTSLDVFNSAKESEVNDDNDAGAFGEDEDEVRD